MITREQVADLQPGDVVEVTDHLLCTTRGPLRAIGSGALLLGALCIVRYPDGGSARPDWSLTVVSRAPRPLYVNHPRTEPVPGDVVRDADDDDDRRTWTKNVSGYSHQWLCNSRHVYVPRDKMPARLRLLVDGETGQVVQ